MVHLLEHLRFWLRCPSFLLSKSASRLKLIQSVVQVGILGMCHKFNFQGLAPRILGLRVASPKFQEPISRVLGVRVPCLIVLVLGSLVSGSCVPESWVSGSRVSSGSCSQDSGSQARKSQVPGSWVLQSHIPWSEF